LALRGGEVVARMPWLRGAVMRGGADAVKTRWLDGVAPYNEARRDCQDGPEARARPQFGLAFRASQLGAFSLRLGGQRENETSP
jgi:hypothetical protein